MRRDAALPHQLVARSLEANVAIPSHSQHKPVGDERLYTGRKPLLPTFPSPGPSPQPSLYLLRHAGPCCGLRRASRRACTRFLSRRVSKVLRQQRLRRRLRRGRAAHPLRHSGRPQAWRRGLGADRAAAAARRRRRRLRLWRRQPRLRRSSAWAARRAVVVGPGAAQEARRLRAAGRQGGGAAELGAGPSVIVIGRRVVVG